MKGRRHVVCCILSLKGALGSYAWEWNITCTRTRIAMERSVKHLLQQYCTTSRKSTSRRLSVAMSRCVRWDNMSGYRTLASWYPLVPARELICVVSRCLLIIPGWQVLSPAYISPARMRVCSCPFFRENTRARQSAFNSDSPEQQRHNTTNNLPTTLCI